MFKKGGFKMVTKTTIEDQLFNTELTIKDSNLLKIQQLDKITGMEHKVIIEIDALQNFLNKYTNDSI